MNCPIFQQYLSHIRTTSLLKFLSMFVTHQDNFIIQFSDNVCDKIGEPCHCINPFSDNVRDIWGQLPCQIFWQCVWQIRWTVSLYQPIFRQWPWHIRSTTLSNFMTMCVTYQDNCITLSSHFLTMSVTYQANYFFKYRNVEKESEKNYKHKLWLRWAKLKLKIKL